MAQDAWLESGFREGAFVLRAGGAWRVQSAAELDRKLDALDPGAARSALIDLAEVESLDSAGAWLLLRTGWQVSLADASCCGRASLSKGLVDRARQHAADLVGRHAEQAARGVPIVGVEPSCLLTDRKSVV